MTKNSISIEELDVSHCLRKEFTLNIIQSLIRDRFAINLIGEKGTGKTRLLEDIQKCILPGTILVNVNLKSYVNNYSGLMREIHRQLELEGEVPERLDKLFYGLEKQPLHSLVFLDNYDALLDNTKMNGKYDKDFFDDLNFINNKDNVSLLCTNCRPHNTLLVFIEGESYGNSWLTLGKYNLPELTRIQIIDEFERQLKKNGRMWLKSSPDDKELLLGCIHQQPLPYYRLCFLAGKLKNQTYEEAEFEFKKRLKRWMRDFKRQIKYSVDKKLHSIKTRAKSTVIASGLDKVKIPFFSDISKFIKKKLGL